MEFPKQTTFIDVGAYDGDSLRRYVKAGGDVRRAHLFEPNPNIEITKTDFDFPITLHRKAAWTSNGYRPFYLSRLYEMEGSTLFPEKTTGNIDHENPIEVQCIDFANWLSQLKHRPLVLKLNAEGAEYGLISAMAEDGILNVLDVIYLSLHGNKIGLPVSADVALHALLAAHGFVRIQSHVYPPRFFETHVRQ